MTQLYQAGKGQPTDEIRKVAEYEGIDVQKLTRRVAKGYVVIPSNKNRNTKPCGVGKGLRTKINANLGSSPELENVELEVKKAKIATEYGADAVMDLSTGPKFHQVRQAIMEVTDLPLGTVPIYQAGITASDIKEAVVNMDEDDMFQAIEEQAREGVDFMTVHSGITMDTVEKVKKSERIMGVVSRGGAFLTAWILHNQEENPLYKNYDYLLEIAREHDVTLSLGDGLRPGCLADASDIPQMGELLILGDLVKRAREADVQVMVEGPGHVPLNQVEANMQIQKTVCKGAPFYVLGPITTDLAPGYDHITSAIGGALAAYSGADFLCYVTPAEHLSIPGLQDVKEGVVASKIAAQVADVANGLKSAWDKEMEMAYARKNFQWEKQYQLSFDPEKARKCREMRPTTASDMCTMCGEFCALRMVQDNI
ncbi:MAG: phosphomethylpyrimidine synthase [Methanobacterium sp.]|uniref:phosphomethylpyrimidine synthase n=1 Tax=Methanobacterium sp. TaxID=2164 RepID=UPI0003C9E482|nr:phosphomethylpyrimidine synthase [Methanobacterium sp.]MDI3549073.1 phosphomethylpyrimidine synthase [Methanobacterium sp.]CDG64272.1 Phosphomethylpyrimidine synthase 2 [Methanobacterium sp. MB1]